MSQTRSTQKRGEARTGRRGHRDRMYGARAAMVRTFGFLAPSDRASRCGGVRGDVDMHEQRGVWHAAGFSTCGLRHLCPCCSVSPRLRRRLEIALAVQRWMDRDKAVVMCTFALPHAPHERLDLLLERLWGTWRSALDTEQGRRWRQRIGLSHWCRATEVTFHRDRGRHPHVHILLFLDISWADLWTCEFQQLLHSQSLPLWRCAERLGVSTFLPSVGLQMEAVRDPFAADYLTKMAGEQGVDREVVSMGTQKDGRNGSIDAMAIPYALAEYGTASNLKVALQTDEHAQWLGRCLLEYRRATADREMIGFSRGLRADLLPDIPEMSDDELMRCAARLRDEYRTAAAEARRESSAPVAEIEIPEPDQPEKPEENVMKVTGVTVSPALWTAWAKRQGDQYLPADALACRRIESAGPWRWAIDIGYAWWKSCGGTVRIYQNTKTGKLRVGMIGSDPGRGWTEISHDLWEDLADAWEPEDDDDE